MNKIGTLEGLQESRESNRKVSLVNLLMGGVGQVESRMRIVGLLSGLVLVALPFGLGGCGGSNTSTAPTGSPSLSPTSPGTPIETLPSPDPSVPAQSSTPKPTLTPKINTQAEVYWLNAEKNKVELVPATVSPAPASKDPKVQLNAAISMLLVGPSGKSATTAIPTGTKLKSLTVKADGVHVDLSQDFSGGGGSAGMQSRLGQVIYTASSLNSADPVWISVEGQPVKLLGGEGVEVSQPMTREEFDKNFSL